MEILQKTKVYVQRRMSGDSSGHDWYHVERVWKLARRLGVHYQADLLVVELAALLHDLGDEKLVSNPEDVRRETINWLQQHGEMSPTVIDHVMGIIDTMSFKGCTSAPMPTLEGQIVQDADRLDALGAIGIARTMAYSGWKGQLSYDPELPPRTEMTQESYRKDRSTAVNHFYEKLFLLKDRMNTGLAKDWAQDRHHYMEQYLDRFMEEWEALDAPAQLEE
jgi:uncharacterized protein